MKRSVWIAFLAFTAQGMVAYNSTVAQCPFTASLDSKADNCFGPDTLFVHSSARLASITLVPKRSPRYDCFAVTALSDTLFPVTGSSPGTASIFEVFGMASAPDGSLFVLDSLNNQGLRFPANTVNASNGITIAGGNGRGAAANQFNIPYGIDVGRVGNLYLRRTRSPVYK